MIIFNLVLALQIQCGVQQVGNKILAYGTLIYTSEHQAAPALAYFESYQDDFSAHAYCQSLKEKMNSQSLFQLQLDQQGKKILGIN